MLALQEDWFYVETDVRSVREALLAHGVRRVWEPNGCRLDPEYEMDTRPCGFVGNETYWASRELD